jgi:hypothetical protein
MSMRNVLAVLEDEEDRLWSSFDVAVGLAEREHARLTLVKTSELEHHLIWCAPFNAGIYVPPDATDPLVRAGRLLARAAEFVPMTIPVTTIVLGIETERELCRLIASGAFDAVVGDAKRLRHARRLRRECGRDRVELVTVQAVPHRRPEERFVPVPVSSVR